MTGWTADDMPDLTGRRAVVTGANAGLGFHTALQLARHGAAVVLAVRSTSKGDRAVRRVRSAVPAADVEVRRLDLADLCSVEEFAATNSAPVDILVNNAGVMAIPLRRTVDGFETQLGTNHLGHFALTGRLLPALLERPGARVVTVSSIAHRAGAIDFADLLAERSYTPWSAYARSKLANLMFALELDRRARAAGRDLVSVAAHPGLASTGLASVGPRMAGRRLTGATLRIGSALVGQRAATGALPHLFAATAPGVRGGDYYGPSRLGGRRGRPARAGISAGARDEEAAQRLWEESERLTSVRFTALDPTGPGERGSP